MKRVIILALAVTALMALLSGCGQEADVVEIRDPVLRYAFSYSGLTMEQKIEMDDHYPSASSGMFDLEDFPAMAAALDSYMEENGLRITQSYLDSIVEIVIWQNYESEYIELYGEAGHIDTVLVAAGVNIPSLEDFMHLKNLKSLEGRAIAPSSIAPAMDMPWLEKLYITYDNVQDIQLVTEMTWLKELGVYYSGEISSRLLEPLTGLNALTLEIGALDNLDFLDGMDSLVAFRLTDVEITDGDAMSIAALPSLKRLFIDNARLRHLDALQGIEYEIYELDGDVISGSYDN